MQEDYDRIIEERADRVFKVMAGRVSDEDMERIRTLQERVVELRKSLRAVQSVLNRDSIP